MHLSELTLIMYDLWRYIGRVVQQKFSLYLYEIVISICKLWSNKNKTNIKKNIMSLHLECMICGDILVCGPTKFPSIL